jgi:hypothetical protein
MKLSIMERLMALQVLPKEGNFVTLNVVRKAQEALSFTEKEIEKYGFKQQKDKVEWDNTANQTTDVDLGNKAISIISEALEKLDKEKKLTSQHLSLYEKFCDES